MRRTSELTISGHTRADATAAFAALTDLARFASWLPRSFVYRGTEPDSPYRPLAVGDTYRDRTPLGILDGRVLAVDPPHRVDFTQTTAAGHLGIDISYSVAAGPGGGSLITRTGTITTTGLLRLVHAPVVWLTGRENRRTLQRLTARLDQRATESHGLTPHS